jgi:hypothetical protein
VAQPEKQPPDEGHPRECVTAELANFKREITLPKGKRAAYQQPTINFSGRHKGGGKATDDRVMTLGIGLLAQAVIEASPVYAHLR